MAGLNTLVRLTTCLATHTGSIDKNFGAMHDRLNTQVRLSFDKTFGTLAKNKSIGVHVRLRALYAIIHSSTHKTEANDKEKHTSYLYKDAVCASAVKYSLLCHNRQ